MAYGTHPTKLAAACLLLAPLASAGLERRHIELVTPQPYVWAEYGPTNPLASDGSDYPCKVPEGDEFQVSGDAPTEMAVGQEHSISFSGTATHGGGSCQFALAEGHAPTKDTPWKVIHSVEGGCPKANVSGNLDDGQSPDTYEFVIPDDFDAGNYTFAWTWVNRIGGQPEFYMNCAPVAVTAAGSESSSRKMRDRLARRQQKTYPDLFLANIGDAANGCDTSDALSAQVAIEYPYPGDSVSHPNGDEQLYKQACDGNSRNGDGGDGSATSSSSSSAAAASTKASSSSLTSAVATLTATKSSSYTAASSSSRASSSSLTPSSSSAAAATATGTTTTTTPSGSCTDGHLLCVGGTQFSTCTGGEWTTPQDLASNARCTEEGESVGLNITNIYRRSD